MYNLRNRKVPRLSDEKAAKIAEECLLADLESQVPNASTECSKPDCGICFEPIEHNLARLEPCGHLFDDSCALTWNRKSTRCAVCRTQVDAINIEVDQSQWKLVWLVPRRYFALVQSSTGQVLSVGSNEAATKLTRTYQDVTQVEHTMDKSDIVGKITTYSLNCPGKYCIWDGVGQCFEVPEMVKVNHLQPASDV